jgi:hypothetical protein
MAALAISYRKGGGMGQITYFEDAETLPMPPMIDRTPWPTMKRFLERQAIKAGRKHLEDLWP